MCDTSTMTTNFEPVDALASADMVEGTPPDTRAQLGLMVERQGATTILSSTGIPCLMFNRAIGLRGGDVDAAGRAVRHFCDRGIESYLLALSSGPDDALEALLAGYGVERYRRAWDVFVRPTSTPSPEAATDLSIRPAAPGDGEAVGAIVAAAFDAPGSEPVFASTIGRPRWHVFVACDAGRVVSTAALFAAGATGYCVFAATEPASRGRGAQRALLARRLEVAAALGCDVVTTETGEPMPGEPDPSYKNLLRAGFQVTERHPNYAAKGATWSGA
jgi:GNAT superfamily N-acetyltransferase